MTYRGGIRVLIVWFCKENGISDMAAFCKKNEIVDVASFAAGCQRYLDKINKDVLRKLLAERVKTIKAKFGDLGTRVVQS